MYEDPLTDPFIMRRPLRKRLCDWTVDDVDDPIGCWQVLLDDGVESAGVIHQDEPLHQPDREKSVLMTSPIHKTSSVEQAQTRWRSLKTSLYLVAFAPQLGSSIQGKVSSLQILVEVLTQDQVVFTHQLFTNTLKKQSVHQPSGFYGLNLFFQLVV